jgi:integrase
MSGGFIWRFPRPVASGGGSSTVSRGKRTGFPSEPTQTPHSGTRGIIDETRPGGSWRTDTPQCQPEAAKAATKAVAENSFEFVTRAWFARQEPGWAGSHSSRIMRRFERDVFPWIGTRPIAEVTTPELLAVIRRIEARTVETAHRALPNCGQVFRYGIATSRCSRDTAADLRGALQPSIKGHFAATTEPQQLGEILRAMDGYNGTPVVQRALRLAPLLFVRPSELRHARWGEFDLTAARWGIPAERMKMRLPHIVPLSTQAIKPLEELHPITGDGVYVFPGARSGSRPMSDNAVLAAMRRMGIEKDEMTGHGLRAVSRTISRRRGLKA